MLCPNCGFNSAPGTMFCGKCGTRLSSAPAQPNPYAQPAQQPYGTQIPPQRTSYIPPAETAGSYIPQIPDAAPRPNYQTYSSPMMQSPYITGAARASSPVLSSSREGAAQYTAVSTNVYSPQARAAAVANEQANKKKKVGSTIMTIAAVVLLAGMACILYFSGIFQTSDNSIYIPPSSGTSSSSPVENTPQNTPPAASDSDTNDVIVSDTDSQAPSDITDDYIPLGMTKSEYAAVNAFISAFTETGFGSISSTISSNELADFAVRSLSMNSSVFDYDAGGFSHGSNTYYYSISESLVKQRVSRYFGEGVQLYPAAGDSGDGWMYYGNSYYFAEIPQSEGFAVLTSYSVSGDIATVEFNIYASSGNDSDYYYKTVNEVEEAGCTLIGSGTAVLGITSYNGRDTYLIQSIETQYN